MSETDTIEADLHAIISRTGLTIPDDRFPAILHSYAELRQMADLIRTMDLGPTDEPANIYGFDPALRGGTL